MISEVGPISDKKVTAKPDFGEPQMMIEILACGSENIRRSRTVTDQTIFVVRVISSGLDLAEPDGRNEVLTALVKLRQFILQTTTASQSQAESSTTTASAEQINI